jgi:polygalacturonase
MKKYYKFLIVGFMLLLTIKVFSQTIVNYPLPSCYTVSSQLTLKVNTASIPVINNTAVYDYAHFSFSGTVTIELTAHTAISSAKISPLKYNIPAIINGNKLTFTLRESRYLIIKIAGMRDLVICADDLETNPPASSGIAIYNVRTAPYNADNTGIKLASEGIQNAINAANTAGGGIVYVPEGVYKCGNLVLKSNVALYLAGGSVIRGSGNPADYTTNFHKQSLAMDGTWFIYTATNADNVKIYGRGTIDGNGSYMRNVNHYLNDLIVPMQCTNFNLDGIICRDSGFWGVIPTRSNNITIKNTKHFNENDLDIEDDAVDIQESQNVTLTHCVLISDDDAFSTKTWSATTELAVNWPGSSEVLNDVVADDIVAWSRYVTFKLGFGVDQPQSNITVKNSTSYRSRYAIALNHKYGTAPVTNVTFNNIDIEGYWPGNGAQSRWLEITNVAPGGPMNNIRLQNINIRNFGTSASALQGASETSPIDGVIFKNIYVPGQTTPATTLAEMNITNINTYVSKVVVLPQPK